MCLEQEQASRSSSGCSVLTFEGQSTGGGPTVTTIALGSFGGFPLGERALEVFPLGVRGMWETVKKKEVGF